MQKLFIIVATIFLSAIAVSAQTASEPKSVEDGAQAVRYASRIEDDGGTAANVNSGPGVKRNARVIDGRVVRLGPTTTYLKNGLSLDEVIRVLGQPASRQERIEGALSVITLVFNRSEERTLVAEFENGLLVRSRMESGQSLALDKK